GLGPVFAPPFSLAGSWSRRPHAPTQPDRRHAAPRAEARADAPRHRPAATPAAAARPSSHNRNRAPTANAPSRPRCGARTRFPATPADHRTACDPDSESGVPSLARAARSAPTTHPRPPMASPSSTPTPNVDDRCRRTSLPPTGSLHSVRASKPQAPIARWNAPYRATIIYRPPVFEIEEQFLLTPRLIRTIDAALRKSNNGHMVRGVVEALGPQWAVSTVNGDTLLVRTRDVHHRDIRFWRPETPLKVKLATPKLHAHTILEPDLHSTVLVKAPANLIAGTSPPTDSTNGGTRTIKLATSSSFIIEPNIIVDS